jgi:hypothetical protein
VVMDGVEGGGVAMQQINGLKRPSNGFQCVCDGCVLGM